MKPKLIEAVWLSYRNAVVPRDAGSVQLQECRRAFYAGACGLYGEIMRLLEPGAEATEADERMMEGIATELAAFNAKVKAGTA